LDISYLQDLQYKGLLTPELFHLLEKQLKKPDITSGLHMLPGLFCRAAGGSDDIAHPLAEIWRYFYQALSLQDKLTDNKQIANLSTGVVLNLITSLLISGIHSFAHQTSLPDNIAERFYETILHMCSGQHQALTNQALTLTESMQVAAKRSGIFFETGAWSGVRCLTDDAAQLHAAAQIGHSLGMMIQIQNDISGLWPTETARSDLTTAIRLTLPVAYALHVLPSAQQAVLTSHLNNAPRNPDAEEKARQIIIESGSLVYLSVELERHYQVIQTHLGSFPGQKAVYDIQALADTRRYVTDK
jgi:geranylgeranyl pyrophosphate synthase